MIILTTLKLKDLCDDDQVKKVQVLEVKQRLQKEGETLHEIAVK